MNRFRLLLLIALSPVLPSLSQVSVEVFLPSDQQQFLAGEALPVSVTVKNRSGQMLHLGGTPDWLTFAIESRDGFVVIKNGEAPVDGSIDLESSQTARTQPVDLSPYFQFPRQGRYNVTATVRLKNWETAVTSGPKSFDIIDGAVLWSQEFGVPGSEITTNGMPEVRKFSLEQANYLRSKLRLYMRLTDVSGAKVFKVTALGPMVSFGHPDAQLDRRSNLHVLYQYGARTFSYLVFNPDGEIVTRQTHEIVGTSRPKLSTGDEGKVGVAGGYRRPAANDLPPLPPLETLPMPSVRETNATPSTPSTKAPSTASP